ncbi:MAG: hypothetical protein OHK0013_23880 [Sandaracinaceae bacterium]
MTVTWGMQRGDARQLALRVQLAEDPDRGRGASPVVAASWGSLALWAGGVNVTAHSDGQESHDAIHWYLLPWLEWLADHWDPLFHEEKLPCRVAGDTAAASLAATAFPPERAPSGWEAEWQAWWKRHAMQSARAGGPFPDVVLRRFRDQLEVSWRSVAPAGVPEDQRFLATDGSFRVDVEAAARVLHEVSGEVVAELARRLPGEPRLETLRSRFASLGSARRRHERLSWLAGLGSRFDEVMAAIRDHVPSAAPLFEPEGTDTLVLSGSCHGTLLFGSVSPSVAIADVIRIAEHMTRAWAPDTETALDALARAMPLAGRYDVGPQGDDLASDAREALGLAEDAVPDELDALLSRWGIAVTDVELSDPSLRGVSFAGQGLCPTVLVNTRAHAAHFAPDTARRRRRFTLAHELCHLLYDRDRGAPLAIASGPWAPSDVERRANAFAAGFLMPASAVAKAVAVHDPTTLEGVRAIADQLDASLSATLARLHVLDYIDDDTEDRLKDQLGPR